MDTANIVKDLVYELNESYDDRLNTTFQQRNNVLSSKISHVLSASYADSDIRDALRALDAISLHNTPAVRRRLRLDVQKELIECNAEIIDEFGIVAEVRLLVKVCNLGLIAEGSSATGSDWLHHC